MDKRLELTKEQKEAWRKLCDALNECEEKGIAIVDDSEGDIYPVNKKQVDSLYLLEDIYSVRKGIDYVELDELECRPTGFFSLCIGDYSFGVSFK